MFVSTFLTRKIIVESQLSFWTTFLICLILNETELPDNVINIIKLHKKERFFEVHLKYVVLGLLLDLTNDAEFLRSSTAAKHTLTKVYYFINVMI